MPGVGLLDFQPARKTKSQTIRAAIRALTRRPGDDPVLELSGDIEGLPADVSENFEQYLSGSSAWRPGSSATRTP